MRRTGASKRVGGEYAKRGGDWPIGWGFPLSPHLDVDVDTVQERAADALLVAGDDASRASTLARRVPRVAAWASARIAATMVYPLWPFRGCTWPDCPSQVRHQRRQHRLRLHAGQVGFETHALWHAPVLQQHAAMPYKGNGASLRNDALADSWLVGGWLGVTTPVEQFAPLTTTH
jgi:hypothetical protein